ncbi:MAG: aminoglycoside phosphotransferase family protein [Bacteroidales bacterium]|nr:aminoglycoside phosphotransferase family protein [Bacteroidales bacterium]
MSVSKAKASELFRNNCSTDPTEVKPFGAGRFSETFYIQDEKEGEYIMRIAPSDSLLQLFYEYRMMRQEPEIHERLLNETTVPVPRIIAYDFSRTLIDRDYLIMNNLPGKPLSEASLSNEAFIKAFKQWGEYVRQIHSLTEPENRFGYVGSHHPMEPQDTWKEAFRIMYRKLLDDIRQQGIYDTETYDMAYQLLEDNLEIFDHCRTSRLCHGDLWVTNLLVDESGQVTGLIDFDRACWGDIEWDLAIAEYCGVTRPPFWEGYGERINTHTGDANIRRMFYLLYEHQKYIIIALSSRRNDPQGAQRYARESLEIMQQFKRSGDIIL